MFLVLSLAVLSPAILGLMPPSAGEEPRVERRLQAMGTQLRLVVEAVDRKAALAGGEAAIRAIEAAETRLSTWRAESELSRFNRSPVGEPVILSAELARDLTDALACSRETDGAFDPTIGRLVRAWSLRDGGRQPSPQELEDARRSTGPAKLELQGRRALRSMKDLEVEEGAFGKGAGLADALAALAADPLIRRASLDLGGQLAFYGEGVRWRFVLADPRDRRREVLALEVDGGSVATSGNSERGFELAGRRHGHLLDPRTGESAPDFGSLTVWTDDPLRADCLSTGLYVLGPEAALAWAAMRDGVEVLVLDDEDGHLRARATAGFSGHLAALTEALELRFFPHEERTEIDHEDSVSHWGPEPRAEGSSFSAHHQGE